MVKYLTTNVKTTVKNIIRFEFYVLLFFNVMWLISIEQVRGVNTLRFCELQLFSVQLDALVLEGLTFIKVQSIIGRPIGNSFLCLQFYVTNHRKISGARSHSTRRLQLNCVLSRSELTLINRLSNWCEIMQPVDVETGLLYPSLVTVWTNLRVK